MCTFMLKPGMVSSVCTFMLKLGMVSEQRVYLHAEAGDGGEQLAERLSARTATA